MSLSRFEQTMLESGVADRPDPARKRAARAALLGAAVVGVTTTTTTTASAAVSTKLTLASKALLVFATFAAAGGATTLLTRSPAPVIAEPPSDHASKVVSATRALTPVPVPVPVPVESPATPVTTLPSTHGTRDRLDIDPLAVEARLLEAARACIANADLACAQARLADHRRQHARGALADEATLLAIDLAEAEGDHAKARSIARELNQRKPAGPWAARIKRLAGEEDDKR